MQKACKNEPLITASAREMCPIVSIAALVGTSATHKKSVGMLLLSLPDTKNVSLALCSARPD